MRRKNDHRLNHLTTQFRVKLAASITLILTLSCLLLPSSASGQTTYTWNTTGLYFDQSGGWDPLGIPGAGDIALFSVNATDTVLWNGVTGDREIGKLHVLGGNYTFHNQATNQYTLRMGTPAGDTILIDGANTALTVRGLQIQGDINVRNNGSLYFGGNHAAGTLLNTDRIVIGETGGGTVHVLNGATVLGTSINMDADVGSTANFLVAGPGSKLQMRGFTIGYNRAGSNTMTIANGGLVDLSGTVFIGNRGGASGTNNITVTGANGSTASTLDIAGELRVGYQGAGTMNVKDGGKVVSGSGKIGYQFHASGHAAVEGDGSRWDIADSLMLGERGASIGRLDVTTGGVVQVGNGTTINRGAMNVLQGGKVVSGAAAIGYDPFGNIPADGNVTIGGVGSRWDIASTLLLGSGTTAATGQLNINPGGIVHVGTTTYINANSSVNMNGGFFHFGKISLDDYSRINGGGFLSGSFDIAGFNSIDSLSIYEKPNSPNLDVSAVFASNSGTLYGPGNSKMSLNNLASGELRTLDGEWVRFSGGGINIGEINNFGGTVEFDRYLTNQSGGSIIGHGQLIVGGTLTNQAGAFIGGRGQFVADGGLTNHGVIAMSGGFADFYSKLTNSSTGTIAIGGGSVTTFFDDVMMDASNMNINVAENSTAVFFGSYNGGSDGLGDVHIFGDLRPGNSPASVFFGGNVLLGSNTFTEIELAGRFAGEFDKLNVAGDLDLAGMLSVSLIDGFELRRNQTFIIADVDGSVFGQFSNFNEGDIVYTQGDIDLFITYDDGNGNVVLYSSIPEPSSAMLMMIAFGLVGLRRRTR